MRFVLFELDGHRYAIDVRQVKEVAPLLPIVPMPHAPAEIAGVAELRGAPMPVIDLSQVMVSRPAVSRLSTRLIVANYSGQNGEPRLLGFIAERVTQTVERQPDDFVETGITNDRTPYLGPVARDADGLLQWVDVTSLVPAPLRKILFAAPGEMPWSSPTSNAS